MLKNTNNEDTLFTMVVVLLSLAGLLMIPAGLLVWIWASAKVGLTLFIVGMFMLFVGRGLMARG